MAQKPHTYSQHMNSWENRKRRSLLARLFSPSPDLPASKRVVGVLLRLGLVLGVPLLVAKCRTEAHLAGPVFASEIAEGLKQRFGAESVKLQEMTWNKASASIPELAILGGATSAIAEARAEGIRFKLPWGRRFAPEWRIDRVTITRLVLRLRGATPLRDEEGKTNPLLGGYGIEPDIARSGISYLSILDLDVHWGDSDRNSGSLLGARATMIPAKEGEGWEIRVEGGTLRQNWLPKLQLEEAKLLWNGSEATFEEAQISLVDGTPGTASGSLSTASLEGRLAVEFVETEMGDFVDRFYRSYLSGTAGIKAEFSGSLAADGIVSSSVVVTPKKAYCQGVTLFEELGDLLLNPSFGKLLMKGGSLQVDASSGNIDKIEGEVEIGSFGTLTIKGRAQAQEFTGQIHLRVEEFALRRAPELKESFFQPDTTEEEWWQKTLPLVSTIDRWFPAELAEIRAIAEKKE